MNAEKKPGTLIVSNTTKYHLLTIHNSLDTEDDFHSGQLSKHPAMSTKTTTTTTTILFKTTPTRTITLDKLLILLGSNHLLNTVFIRTTLTRTITLDKLLILLSSNHSRNNSLYKDHTHPDDHTRQTTDTPEFKPFTKQQSFEDYSHPDDHTVQTTLRACA